MTYVKFNPKPFEQGFSSLVDSFISEWPAAFKKDFKQSFWKDLAPVNVKEKNGSYLLEVIAPGFEKADFKINIDNDFLTISGEKKNAEQKDNGGQDEKYIRTEYNNRFFKRSFTLDEKIDATKIEANYVNGILTLNLPKKEAVKAAVKEITIQ